jgi:hypothetical protein
MRPPMEKYGGQEVVLAHAVLDPAVSSFTMTMVMLTAMAPGRKRERVTAGRRPGPRRTCALPLVVAVHLMATARNRLAPSRVYACLTAAGVSLLPSTAVAGLNVKWDCYLPNASVDCMVLESSLRSNIPFLRFVPVANDADVAITMTSLPAEDSTRFVVVFRGRLFDGYVTEVRTTDKIPSSIDATTATVRLMTKLERGLSNFMDQKVVAAVDDGALSIRLVDPTQLPYTGRPEQQGVKWYVAPTVGTYFSDVQGVGVNASGNASLSFNLSEPKWRLQQSLGANYSQESQPVPGTTETASISFAGGNASTLLSSAVTNDNRWNGGLLLATERNPQANYRLRANGSAGLEFDLIPRETVNQKNLGMRCAVGMEFQHYGATNVQELDQQVIGRQFCDVFVNWHFIPFDLSASLGETTVLENIDYRSVYASASLTWRLTDNLSFAPWLNLQQVNQAINEPRPTNQFYSDPRQEIEASMLAAVQQSYAAPFGMQLGFSIRLLLGNGSLSSEDQRWKNASNLR